MERGADAYRRGEFEQAALAYAGVDGADAHYNRGNALAKAGKYEEAIAAYDEALRRQSGMADAIANKRAVEAMLKRKPPGGSQGQEHKEKGQQQGEKPEPGSEGEPAAQGPGQDGANPRAKPGQSPLPPESASPPASQSPPKPADAEAQAAAEAAQRERMQRALDRQKQSQPDAPPAQAAQVRAETPGQRERRLANEAWLKRIPDDPGGLLRAK